jgi:hypothetical protein
MNQWGWLIAGLAAATGTITMCWNYIRSFWTYVKSQVIVTCEIQGDLEEAVSMYCWTHFRHARLGIRSYLGWTIFVRPTKRVQLVGMEIIGKNGKVFWRGPLPIWTKRIALTLQNDVKMRDRRVEGGLLLSFIRGTFNLDRFLSRAIDEYNQTMAAGEHQTRQRYFVKHVFGTDGKTVRMDNDESCAPDIASNDGNPVTSLQNRLLQWGPDDLGVCRLNGGNALGHLALSTEANSMVEEIKRWRANEDWYKARGIPWRRGWLLHGPPGTGKTSFIRAIAEDLDLPIYVFHLSTLYDDELQKAWQRMQRSVPCIALIEDIDAVFKGRENVAGGHLTFDCLLNCIDGIERTGGIFVAVTTNRLDSLDTALGTPTADNSSTRPGRLDRVLKMRSLDEEGRRTICKRILAEWPEIWDEVVRLGSGETGAQFENRCTQKAIELFWS